MSEQNVAIVRAIWDAVNRGDLDEAFEYAPDDFVADWSGSEAPESGVYRGREAVKGRTEYDDAYFLVLYQKTGPIMEKRMAGAMAAVASLITSA